MAELVDQLPLAAEFPAASREDWLRLVDGVLKGGAFEKKLVSRSYDGLHIEPLYPRTTSAPVLRRSPGAPWRVMQRVDHPDAALANREALHELEGGATGLTLVFSGAIGSTGFGLDASPAIVGRALADIRLDAGIAVELDLGPQQVEASAALAEAVKHSAIAPDTTDIWFGLDPLGRAAAAGGATTSLDQLLARLPDAIAPLANMGFAGPFAIADGRIVHNAGGSEAQELSFCLAVGVSYLRALEPKFALDIARRLIAFRLSADADQLLTIAKLRALRKLWARVEAACGLAPKPIRISAETAWRVMSRRDPFVNLLRAALAVFSAGIGGADHVCALPYTAALGLADRFARRLARNTQLVLLEESNLAKVADPAAGSGAVEDLTQKLCVAAWTLFQGIEEIGGAAKALEQGLIQNGIAATRRDRQAAVASRRDPLTGVSEFPDIKEVPVSVLEVAPMTAVATAPIAVTIDALPKIRLAEPFERLRDASDRILAETGNRPKIFLANLGSGAEFGARATFAKNFFEVGGIEAVTNDGFAASASTPTKTNLAALLAAFTASNTALVCFCSSDELYARELGAAINAVRTLGPRAIYVAGRPGDMEQSLVASGVTGFIHVGCDSLALLEAAHRRLAH
jgi:methylmalonyl-CoA mutase